MQDGDASLAVTARAMKDKTGGHASELPPLERGASRGAGKRAVPRDARSTSRGDSALRTSSRTDKGSSAALLLPIQAVPTVKAASKKTAGKSLAKARGKPGKKLRR